MNCLPSDPKVAIMAAGALKIVAIMQHLLLIIKTQFILAGALLGAGDTVWPLILL